MVTFSTLQKTFKFVELFIEGTFGEGFTLKDFVDYDRKSIKEALSPKFNVGSVFIVVRETGTQALYTSLEGAKREANRWSNSKMIIEFARVENGFTAKTYKID